MLLLQNSGGMRCRRVCISKSIRGADAVMSAVGCATGSMSHSQRQSLLLEAMDAIQVSAFVLQCSTCFLCLRGYRPLE